MVIEECRHGHKMTPENTFYRLGRPTRPSCRECKRLQRNRSRAQKKTDPTPRAPHRWYGDKCIHGHVLTEETAGKRMTSAGVRLYCRECSRINGKRRFEKRDPLRRRPRTIGDICAAGKHVLTEDNARLYPKRGSYTCLDCRRERDALNSTDPNKGTRSHHRASSGDRKIVPRPNRESLRGAHNRRRQERSILRTALQTERLLGDELSKADDERPGAIWNLLKPTGKTLQALDELQAAQDTVLDDGGSWNCRDTPEAWMDSWLDEDDEGNRPEPPAPNRVRSMCADCPLFAACQNYGKVSRDPGIWGGLRVDTDGKIYD